MITYHTFILYPLILVLLNESITLFKLSAVFSAESAPLYEPEVQGLKRVDE